MPLVFCILQAKRPSDLLHEEKAGRKAIKYIISQKYIRYCITGMNPNWLTVSTLFSDRLKVW